MSWPEANQRYLTAALAVLRARLNGEPDEAAAQLGTGPEAVLSNMLDAMPQPPAVEAVKDGFGLSDFERDVLLMCAGVELDTAFAAGCEPTFGLALARLPKAHWSALTPAAPLRHWHLVEVVHPESPTSSPIRIDERVLHALTGIGYPDPRVSAITSACAPPPSLPRPLRRVADRLAALWQGHDHRQVQLHGRQRPNLLAVAACAAAAFGAQPLRLRAAELPPAPADRELLARLCERESVLTGAVYVIEADDDRAGQLPGRAALDFCRRLHAPGTIVARDPLPEPGAHAVQLAVPDLGPADLRALWDEALGAGAPDGWVGRVCGQFDLDVDALRSVAAEVRPALGGDPERAGRLLWEECRARTRPDMEDLAQRIEPRARWEDLVLPEPQRRTLAQITLHTRHRLQVLHEWGFAAHGSRGLGTAALFSGPSGTGKTLAAEVIAGEVGLDLYRIDLSQVVSKYIGETEKNLRRVFDAAESGAAVLLFDEADALFGKRGEVRDSHDRYANIEVSYLLQRMEEYRGLAVLTTNRRSALDPAFLRRLRFAVEFPFPGPAERAEIWRRAFPPQTPVQDLDLVRLAQLTVSGGVIRNIALAAAYLAAGDGGPVRMGHLLAAAHTEYAKAERPLTDAETKGWNLR